MATLRQLIPLPCANGVDPATGLGRVSVYFSPRLLIGGQLGGMPDWANWPAAFTQLTITFTTNNGIVPAAGVTRVSSPSSAIYAAVFSSTTPVTPYTPTDRRGTPFTTFPEADIAADILALYADLAAARPLTPPTVQQLMSRPTTSSVLTGGGVLAPAAAAAADYQQRMGALPTTTQPQTTWDFHQAVSLLGRHPHLMRLLGIVVDYEIPLGVNPTRWIAASTDYETVLAPPIGSGNRVQEISPRVMVTNDFRIRPLRSQLSGGFLSLGATGWDLVSLDVKNAVRKLGALAREVTSDRSSGALPALTDGGLAVLRTGRASDLAQQFADDFALEQQIQQAAQDNDTIVEVYAEHLRVGYRVDARRNTTPPRSLFERQAEAYHFPANPALDLVPPADEGWVGTSYSADRTSSGLASSNRLPDSLARWRGWSLAVPPPGKAVDSTTGEAVAPTNAVRVTDPVQFQTDYGVVPGTLPRLRYGHTYALRARVVDITGNSVPVDAATPANAETDEQVFARLDPLPPPVVMRRQVRPTPGLGDTVDRLVIKSNYDTPLRSIASNDRLVFPPSASHQTCERHGFPNGGLSGSTTDYALIAGRDGLDPSDQALIDPATNEAVAGVDNGGSVGPGPTSQVAAYLPDPAGPMLSLGNVPGATGQVLVSFAGTWPDWSTQRLVLSAPPTTAQAAPDVDTAARSVTVFLPKAGQQVIELSLAPGADFAKQFGIMRELIEADPTNLDRLTEYVRDGRHWMVSSRRTIKLVHAVRQPLRIPALESLTADRPEIGSHTVSLVGTTGLNRASTGRVVLTGTWTDPVDNVADALPSQRSGQILLGTQKVGLAGAAGTADISLELRFPDARRHQVLVKQEAFTRFARDFAEQKDVTFTAGLAGRTQVLDDQGVLAASVRLGLPDGSRFTEGTDYSLDPAAGTVTRLVGGTIPVDQPVTAIYVALPLSRFSDEAGAGDVEVTVPNAKHPAPLAVHALIPSFKRTAKVKKSTISVVTNPHVIRVYLDRPWFDTGVGELLGVVLDPSSGTLPDVPRYTRFARDATFQTGSLPRPLRSHFPGGTGLTSDGYLVAGHRVRYDTGRRQWYADIEISAPLGYRAQVQLGLARLQPEAIEGAGLSRVSMQDPVMLGAIRKVVVTNTGTSVDVSVTGVEHEGKKVAGLAKKRFNKISVSVQEADSGIADPDLSWTGRPLGSDIALKRTASASSTTWAGSVKLKKISGGGAIRLVITESEPFAATDAAGTAEILEYRPVFTEVIPLPRRWTS